MSVDPQPIVSVADFGATPGSGLDATAAINAALDSLTAGGTVVFPPGQYHHAGPLYVTRDGTRVRGYGATLTATAVDQRALFVIGRARVEVLGVSFFATPTVRNRSLSANAITVQSSSEIRIEDCTITGSSGVGIMITYDSYDYVICNNTITGTKADGIHNTSRVHNGLIVGNTIADVDDDGISVVSYVSNTNYTHDIQIVGNRVTGTANGYGRGITVVGGRDVQIVGNLIEGVKAAGILLASESGYNSYGAKNVLVACNNLRRVSWGYPPNHGGILVYSRSGTALAGGATETLANESVVLDRNTLDDTLKGPGHVRLGPYGQVAVMGTVVYDADGNKPWLYVSDTTQLTYTTSGNTYNGVVVP